MKSKYPFRITANIDAETHRFFKLLGYGERQKFLREAIREKRGIQNGDPISYQCEAHTKWVNNPRCENTARIEILGGKYCHLHASHIAANMRRMNNPTSKRCECTIIGESGWGDEYRKSRERDNYQCRLKSRFKVNGINCCYHHAKIMILQHMIKDGTATVLPYNGSYKPLCNLNK